MRNEYSGTHICTYYRHIKLRKWRHKSCANDKKMLKGLKEVMATQTKDITLLTSSNVTRANVLEKLSAICNRAQKMTVSYFFYSGHGMPGAICGYDAAISYEDIVALLEGSLAKEKILFYRCLSCRNNGQISDR